MKHGLEDLIEKDYLLEIPMPVVSIGEITLLVETPGKISGYFKIVNAREISFRAIVETKNNLLIIDTPFIEGKEAEICYSYECREVNNNSTKNDSIIITYNGGEITIPVKIQFQRPLKIQKKSQLVKKLNSAVIEVETDKASYTPEQSGKLFLTNNTGRELRIDLLEENGYIQFKEKSFWIKNEKTIDFSFKIPKIDRMIGKIPLKANPEVALPFSVIYETDGICRSNRNIIITEFNIPNSDTLIESAKHFRNISIQFYRELTDYLISNQKYKLSDTVFDQLKGMLSYDKTNVELRLLFCMLLSEHNKKEKALQEISNIDRFIIYYDNKKMSVSDILFVLLELIKEDDITYILSRWKLESRDDYLRIMLKNRYLVNYYNKYEDYKKLFEMGIKTRILFAEASVFINNNPFIPLEEDKFYRTIFAWAVRNNCMGAKWNKRIEANVEILISYNNVNDYIIRKLYFPESNKAILTLASGFYVKNEYYDEYSREIFERAIRERCRIIGLERAYIITSYNCNTAIKLEGIRTNFKLKELDDKVIGFFLLNCIVQKEENRGILYSYEKEISEISQKYFENQQIRLSRDEKRNYVKYLIENREHQAIWSLIEYNRLADVELDIRTEAAVLLSEYDIKKAKEFARELYDNGAKKELIMKIIAEDFKGTTEEYFHLKYELDKKRLFSSNLSKEFIIKGILTRKIQSEIVESYMQYKENTGNIDLDEYFNSFIAGQILIEGVIPSPRVIEHLEQITNEENVLIELSLLKAYIKYKPAELEVIKHKLERLIQKDIVFSWFEELMPLEYLGESIQIRQFFEYSSKVDKCIFFNYRIENQFEYKKIQMQHVALGLYIVNIIMFYNEQIQYYIEETDKFGNTDIKISQSFQKKDLPEIQGTEGLIDIINTIEVSREFNDEISLEKTAMHYLKICNKEIEDMSII